MTSVNRFALLDDEPAPKPVVVAAPVAPAAPAKNDQRPPRNNQGGNYQGGNNYNQGGYSGERGNYVPREDRGDGGRGGRGRDRPYRPRSAVDGPRRDGEFSNTNKREYDGHVSRTDYVRRGGRGGRGGGRGAKRDGEGRFNAGSINEVGAEQSVQDALNSVPAADADTPAAEAVEGEEVAPVEVVEVVEVPVEPEEIDTTITLAQFLAKKAAAAQSEVDAARNVREAGEDVVEEDFQNAKPIDKEEVDDVLGAAVARAKKESSGNGPKLVEKKTIDIDIVFAAPAGGRGGRGGRGGYRGGRGGYQARAQPVNILDNRAFPALGK